MPEFVSVEPLKVRKYSKTRKVFEFLKLTAKPKVLENLKGSWKKSWNLKNSKVCKPWLVFSEKMKHCMFFYFFSSKYGHLLQSSVTTLTWLQFILLSQFLWLLMVVYFKTKDLQLTRFYLFLGSSSEFVNRPRTLSNAATI